MDLSLGWPGHNVTRGPQAPISGLARREICQRTIFLGALCKIAIWPIFTDSEQCPLHITGSYHPDRDRLLSGSLV